MFKWGWGGGQLCKLPQSTKKVTWNMETALPLSPRIESVLSFKEWDPTTHSPNRPIQRPFLRVHGGQDVSSGIRQISCDAVFILNNMNKILSSKSLHYGCENKSGRRQMVTNTQKAGREATTKCSFQKLGFRRK